METETGQEHDANGNMQTKNRHTVNGTDVHVLRGGKHKNKHAPRKRRLLNF